MTLFIEGNSLTDIVGIRTWHGERENLTPLFPPPTLKVSKCTGIYVFKMSYDIATSTMQAMVFFNNFTTYSRKLVSAFLFQVFVVKFTFLSEVVL